MSLKPQRLRPPVEPPTVQRPRPLAGGAFFLRQVVHFGQVNFRDALFFVISYLRAHYSVHNEAINEAVIYPEPHRLSAEAG
jgi:hypothetical protein